MIIEFDNDTKTRLDLFIAQHLSYNRSKIAKCIESGFVLVNNKIQKTSYKLKKQDKIEVLLDKIESFLNPSKTLVPYDFSLNIVFEDDSLAVINKPKNLLVHPTKFDDNKTLVNALIYRYGNNLTTLGGIMRPGIVHRLDKNTAGLMMIAKTDAAYKNLACQIREKKAKRKYLAIALGQFNQKEGIIDKPLVHYINNNVKMTIAENNEGLSALTCYKVIDQYKGAALVELELKTGRTHQIRAHLASINHPVFGDSLYKAKSFLRNEFYNLKTQEQLLQSYYLSFNHPITNEVLEFQLKENDFSEDFIKVLNFLRSKNINEH